MQIVLIFSKCDIKQNTPIIISLKINQIHKLVSYKLQAEMQFWSVFDFVEITPTNII